MKITVTYYCVIHMNTESIYNIEKKYIRGQPVSPFSPPGSALIYFRLVQHS